MKYRDRIVGLVRIRGDRILPNPLNWRTHGEEQRAAIRGVLGDIGVGAALIAVPADETALKEVTSLKVMPIPKYRYVLPLDDAMRAQIAPLAKPYPKRKLDAPRSDGVERERVGKGSPGGTTTGEGGSIPTPTLQGHKGGA